MVEGAVYLMYSISILTLILLLIVELYKMSAISLSRGAEIAGVSLEEFKEVLADRGVVRTLSPSPDIDDNVARILEEKD
jgi:hypothetical protein